MAYEELLADLLKAEREEDVTAALKIFGLEKSPIRTGSPMAPSLFRGIRRECQMWAHPPKLLPFGAECPTHRALLR